MNSLLWFQVKQLCNWLKLLHRYITCLSEIRCEDNVQTTKTVLISMYFTQVKTRGLHGWMKSTTGYLNQSLSHLFPKKFEGYPAALYQKRATTVQISLPNTALQIELRQDLRLLDSSLVKWGQTDYTTWHSVTCMEQEQLLRTIWLGNLLP